MDSNKIRGNDQLTRQIRKYLSWLTVSSYSPQTVSDRRKQLVRFRDWCLEREINTPQTINKRELEQYRRFLFYYRKADGTALKSSLPKFAFKAPLIWLNGIVFKQGLKMPPLGRSPKNSNSAVK